MIENCTSTTAKLAVIWIGALLLALPELLIRQLVADDTGLPDEPPVERCIIRISTSLPDMLYVLGLTYEGARLWWCFGCYFCLPTLFTIGCSLVTARKIRHAEQASVRSNKKQIRLESQMNCTVVALAIVYGACVVPENICNIVSAYMAAGVPEHTMSVLHLLSQLLLFCRAAVTPALLLLLCRPLGRAFLDCCCCCCCNHVPSSATASDDNEHECTTELELSPFSTIRRELSNYTPAGSNCWADSPVQGGRFYWPVCGLCFLCLAKRDFALSSLHAFCKWAHKWGWTPKIKITFSQRPTSLNFLKL